MTLNIDSIQNPTLKRAAEIADSSGKTAFDNNLDQSELSVFIKSAYQNNVSTEEIMEVVNQVGIPQEEGDEAQQTVAKLNSALGGLGFNITKQENNIRLETHTIRQS